MAMVTSKFGMGASALRLEDDAFVTGRGRYTDDIRPADALYGFVLRSPVAKARFSIGPLDAARAAPGVRLVLTGADVAHLLALKTGVMRPGPDGTVSPTRDIPILCRERVNYVGDAVAFVVADTRALAQDAAELIEVDYDTEDAIACTARALDADAPLVWPELGSNRAFLNEIGDRAATDAAFAKAAKVTRIEYVNNRLVCNYMEVRSAIGEWKADENRFVLTTGTQGVHSMRANVARVFGIAPSELRVITPDVGGGFGPKTFAYREYPLVLEAAKRLGRPVKWTSDRSEHFLTDAQGRDNYVVAEMAMDGNARFLGLRIALMANLGAYLSQYGPGVPYAGASMATGVYDIPALHVMLSGIYTNTCPVDAYRGAGRPEAAFLLEKMADACARDMGLAPDEIRRRNFIQPSQFPYRNATDKVYDVGEFEGHMNECMELAGWRSFPERLEQSRAAGKIRGIGISTYIEAAAAPGSEPVHVELNGDGSVTLLIGTQSNGQGHATVYAQFVAEKLNIELSRIHVIQGDTDRLAKGGGTGGSRSVPLGGPSAARAGEDLARKIRKIAAQELEASAADIELADGLARVAGTNRSITFAEIAKAAGTVEDIRGFGEFVQRENTYPNGTHICEVEIDPETGEIKIVAFTIVDDFGATVNPILLEGQVHGGVVQGIGQALTENAVYSDEGQLLTATFMDYAMPRADTVPSFRIETRNVPSTTNELGIKGAGEAGTTGSTPAVMNAVTDALYRAYGIRHIEMPATSHRIWSAIQAARATSTIPG